jgi:hypothetical protein
MEFRLGYLHCQFYFPIDEFREGFWVVEKMNKILLVTPMFLALILLLANGALKVSAHTAAYKRECGICNAVILSSPAIL